MLLDGHGKLTRTESPTSIGEPSSSTSSSDGAPAASSPIKHSYSMNGSISERPAGRVSFQDDSRGASPPADGLTMPKSDLSRTSSPSKGKGRLVMAEDQIDPLDPLDVLRTRTQAGLVRSSSTRSQMHPFTASPEQMSSGRRRRTMVYASSDSQTSLSPAPSTSASSGQPRVAPEMQSLQQILQSVDLEAALKVVQTLQSKPVVVEKTAPSVPPKAFQQVDQHPGQPTSLLPAAQILTYPDHLSNDSDGLTPSTPGLNAASNHQDPRGKVARRRTLSFAFPKARQRTDSVASQTTHRDSPPQRRPSSDIKAPAVRRGTLSEGSRGFEEQISKVHLSLSPQTLSRANKTSKYFALRYDPVFEALQKGQRPPNLLEVSRWRIKADEHERQLRKAQVSNSIRGREAPAETGAPLEGVRSGFSSDASAPVRKQTAVYGTRRNKRPKWCEIYPDDISDFVVSKGRLSSPDARLASSSSSPRTPAMAALTSISPISSHDEPATSFMAQKKALHSGVYTRPLASRQSSSEALPLLHPLNTRNSNERGTASPLRTSTSAGGAPLPSSVASPLSGPAQLMRENNAFEGNDGLTRSRSRQTPPSHVKDDAISSPRIGSNGAWRSTVKRLNPMRMIANDDEHASPESNAKSDSFEHRRSAAYSEPEDGKTPALLGVPPTINRSRRSTPSGDHRASGGEDKKRNSTIRGRIMNAARQGFRGGLESHVEGDYDGANSIASRPLYRRRGDIDDVRACRRAQRDSLPVVDIDEDFLDEFATIDKQLQSKIRGADESLAKAPKDLGKFISSLSDLRISTEDIFGVHLTYPYPRLSGHILALVAQHARPPPRDPLYSSGEESDTDTSGSSSSGYAARKSLRPRTGYRTPTAGPPSASPRKQPSLDFDTSQKGGQRPRRLSSAASFTPGHAAKSSSRSRSQTVSMAQLLRSPGQAGLRKRSSGDKRDVDEVLSRTTEEVQRLVRDVSSRSSTSAYELDEIAQKFAALQREADSVAAVVYSKHAQQLRALEDHFDRVKQAYKRPEFWNQTTLNLVSIFVVRPLLFVVRMGGLVIRHWRLFATLIFLVVYDTIYGQRVVWTTLRNSVVQARRIIL